MSKEKQLNDNKKSEKEETKYKNKPKNENNLYDIITPKQRKVVYRWINHLECIVSYITYNSKRNLEVNRNYLILLF